MIAAASESRVGLKIISPAMADWEQVRGL